MSMDILCMEKVDLFIAGRSLPKIQMMSNIDAYAVVLMKENSTGKLIQIGMTPVIMDCANPDWTTAFTMDYMFEVVQEITVRVYHYHDGTAVTDFAKQTFVGETTFILASLMTIQDQKMSPELTGGKHTGHVELRVESHTNTRDIFCATFKGIRLSNKDGFFGTSDPFLVVSRMNEDGKYTVVWKSSKVDNSLSPVWPAARIPMSSLCNGDVHRPLKLEIFDWDSNGKHQSMGHAETSVTAMLSLGEGQLDVIEPEKVKSRKGYTNSGHIAAAGASIEHKPTFTQFVSGGCEISLIAAIDFTGSNGDPDMPTSLHHISPTGAHNPYQSMILSAGKILEHYDTDKKYPVFGFGAKMRLPDGSQTEAQHCFHVNPDGLEVQGINGIMQAYKDGMSRLFFSGPTLFAPIINASTAIAAGANCRQDKQKYTILLIITDGLVNDMEATKAALVAASAQPLSVIIIGVGSADFSGMNALDSDKQMLSSCGKTASRDIVQFVARTNEEFPVLVQKVLAEIPDQVLQYMEQHHIQPNKK